jgi:hypothetical protein
MTIKNIYEHFLLIKYRYWFICADEKNIAESILIKTRDVPFLKFTIQLYQEQ